jgi:tight adherence protein B
MSVDGSALLPVALCAGPAALAVALLLPPRSVLDGPRAQPGRMPESRRWLLLAVAVGAGGAGLLGRPEAVVIVLVGAGAVAVGGRMVVRRHRDRAAAAVRAGLVELCDAVCAELAAGQTALVALERAASEWRVLDPAVRVARAGGDVPAAIRSAATVPGAGDLRILAAAWQVADRTGHGLGDAVAGVARELRAAEQTRRVVTGELASARATARLVAALPLAALAMGAGAGAEPWTFLLGHPVGLACLAGGLACGLLGLAWIEALARGVEQGR